jgi:hypothetical protein
MGTPVGSVLGRQWKVLSDVNVNTSEVREM